MKRTPMSIARSAGNRKGIFAMIQRQNLTSAVSTTHLKQVGNANPSTIVNERSQALATRHQQTRNDFNPGDKSK